MRPAATALALPKLAVPRLAGPALAAAAALCVCLATAVVDPYKGQTPDCPFHALTGLWCPGCGSSRAIYSLTHGDVTAAFARNPLMLLALPYVAWAWLAWLLDASDGPHLWRLPQRRWVPIAIGLVIGAYGVARNIPWPPLRVLGPG